MRRAVGHFALVVSVCLLLAAGATPASADPNSPGNNGTIKIHESPGEREPAMANDPHVCLFHIHGFKFDNNSTGEAWIESWPPTGDRSQVWHGTWSAGSTGEWRTGDIRLADGHYKAYAKQMNEATPGGDKQKVFWVECAGQGGGATGGTGATGSSGSGGNGNGNSGGNGNGNSGGNGNGNSGGNGSGNGSSAGSGNTGGTVSSGGSTSAGATMATTTTTAAAGAASSGSAGVVAGVQSAPQAPSAVAGVENLPSTSTDGQAPLVVLGMVILATGVVLLRRPGAAPTQ
jgi:LPXTG-motif cell wall-anchored protein